MDGSGSSCNYYPSASNPSDRKWVAVAPTPSGSDASFRVVSYNVLADCYTTNVRRIGNYVNELTRATKDDVSWSKTRLPRILSEMECYSGDVICMQEVEEISYVDGGDLAVGMEKVGFDRVGFCPRDTTEAVAKMPKGNMLNGSAIFRKRDGMVEIIASRALTFCNEVEALMQEVTTGVCNDFRGRLDGSLCPDGPDADFNTSGQGAAMLALFRHAVTGQLFVVASVHLYFDFRFNDTKTAQTLMLTRAIARFVAENMKDGDGSAVPVIICGDFNSMPEGRVPYKLIKGAKHAVEMEKDLPAPGGAYRLLQTGYLERTHQECPPISGWAAIESDLTPMRSAYGGNDPTQELECTSRDLHYSACLDFIFLGATKTCGEKKDGSRAIVTEVLSMPYEQGKSIQFGPIPDAVWPSDHIAVGATVYL